MVARPVRHILLFKVVRMTRSIELLRTNAGSRSASRRLLAYVPNKGDQRTENNKLNEESRAIAEDKESNLDGALSSRLDSLDRRIPQVRSRRRSRRLELRVVF